MRYKSLYFFLIFLLSCQCLLGAPLPELSADGAILIDVKSDTVLYAKNMSIPFYPASTTKILTSLAVLQDMKPTQIVTKTQDAVNNVPSDSSQVGLNVGDSYSVFDGLHAVLMSSDNFVCYDLAKADAGTISNFATKMNALAFSSGATEYNFVNPHGYHDPNHYTSPFALARIGIAAFANPTLEEIAGTYKYNFTVANTGRIIPLTHTVALLDPNSKYYNSHVVAAKSGFHDAARRTLVAKAVYGDMELVGVVMRTDAPLQFEDMNKLFKYGAENFKVLQDTHDEYRLENRTYSDWAEPYITEALANGWIPNNAHNYQFDISQREFINLLASSAPIEFAERLSDQIHYNGMSLFTENRPVTKADAAKIITHYLDQFELTPLETASMPTDISKLDASTQEAIKFCINADIFTVKNNAFNPNQTLTYEEAVCISSKLHKIATRYQSFHL